MNLQEIWDTPGYFYGIAYTLATGSMIAALKAGRLRAKDVLSQAVLMAFLVSLLTLTKGARGLPFAAVMVTVVTAVYMALFQTLRDAVKAGFYTVKAFIYGELSASGCWLIYYHLALHWPVFLGWHLRAAVMALMFALFFTGFILTERRLLRNEVDLAVTVKDLTFVALTGLSVYVVSNLGYIDRNTLFSGSYARDVFAIRTLVDMSGVAMIYAYHSQLMEVQVRLEKDALHNIMETQYQAYKLSRESIDMVNQKYHDLKHQIALLRSQAVLGRADAYLRQMEQEIRSFEAMNQTGNPVLDVMLTNKMLYCQKHGIELKCIADGALLAFMEDMDISSLFGNMMDNAIESVERLEDPRKRLIRLYVAGENGFLRIRAENYCEERIRFRDGMPQTTKMDHRYHGFGMKSMQRTVAKYGGSLMAAQSDNWFILKILIPMAASDVR